MGGGGGGGGGRGSGRDDDRRPAGAYDVRRERVVGQGDGEDEFRPGTRGRVLHPCGTAMTLRDRRHDAQPQAAASGAARVGAVTAVEAGEDAFALVGGDAASVVAVRVPCR